MLNLTQHPATPAQEAAGLVNLEGEYLVSLKKLITFEGVPTLEDLEEAANDISYLVHSLKGATGGLKVLIGGAPWFMPTLERVLKGFGMEVYYAFSKRESIETTKPDGSVVKYNVFNHVAFVQY